jgi:hypothetical protein
MRLGQLARKLALRPSQIVDYLATKQIFPDEGSNARLSDEVTERVVLHFAPGRLNEIMAVEEKNTEPAVSPEPVQEEPVITQEQEEVVAVEATPTPVIEVTEEKSEVEVIKAPKVELSGLKVLGKIELPEPKKKTAPVTELQEGTEMTTEGEAEKIPATEKKQRRPEPRVNTQRRDSYPQRPARNPIAVQREEKRTQYYLQRVKTGQPTKAAKMIDEPTESLSLKEEKPAPKTWFGKFLRWLNT